MRAEREREKEMMQHGYIVVASVSIIQDGMVLIIKETKEPVANQWNFPGGRVERGEDVTDAACREVREETGYEINLTGTTGVYPFAATGSAQVLLFHFTAEIAPESRRLHDYEMSECKWVPASELLLPNKYNLRGEAVIRRITENLIVGRIYPLAFFNRHL